MPGARAYVGQADSMRHRVNGYSNPGPASQTTNNRISPLLCTRLATGQLMTIAMATAAEMTSGGRTTPLNLADTSDRTLGETPPWWRRGMRARQC